MNWKCFFGQHQWKTLETREIVRRGTSSVIALWDYQQCKCCGKTSAKTHRIKLY